ncbi:trypsin-like peptidase domain-containing protein [Isoptericola hypogeus]
MSTDNTGAPQQPSGADRPHDQHAENAPERAEAPGSAATERPATERPATDGPATDRPAGGSPGEQPTQRIPMRQDADRAAQPQEQPTQQLPTPPQPPQQQAPHQPRYGAVAPGSAYGQQGQPYGQGQYGQSPYGAPQGHQPQQAKHGQQAPGDPYATGQGHGAPGQPATQGSPAGGTSTRTGKQRSVWLPVTSAAVAAAVLASLGTAAATGAFDDSDPSSSLADVGTSRAADEAPVSSSTAENPDWQAVTDAVAPSVVAIQTSNAEGSGVIYDDQGHVLTNNHVVSGAENDTVQVSLADGRLYEATIVGTDPTTDLAVVQIQDPPDDLQPAAFGSSDDVVVGDPVLAVGNPLGLANTATTGIVSAVDRPVSASGEDGSTASVTNAIQIDAAVNPGNSGGPLFNSQGQVIGITSSIATMSGGMSGSQSGSIGLGFAIPVNLAANVADQLIADGTAEHAFLGVSMTDGTATADGVTRRGAQVAEVTAGSPAAEAGLQAGDVIVAIDDDPVNGAESLTAHVREKEADQQVTLTYVRDGATSTVDVTLAVREETASTGQGEDQQGEDQQGQDQQDQQGQDGSDDGSQGSDPTLPDNIPGWLEDLLQGGGSGS